MRAGAIALVLAALLAGCGGKPPPPPTPQEALALKPADPLLADFYETSCKACHAIPNSGAPMVHDQAAWGPRWKKGLPTLVDHAIQGYGAMPALGQCVACTPADFEGLIRFMADRETK